MLSGREANAVSGCSDTPSLEPSWLTGTINKGKPLPSSYSESFKKTNGVYNELRLVDTGPPPPRSLLTPPKKHTARSRFIESGVGLGGFCITKQGPRLIPSSWLFLLGLAASGKQADDAVQQSPRARAHEKEKNGLFTQVYNRHGTVMVVGRQKSTNQQGRLQTKRTMQAAAAVKHRYEMGQQERKKKVKAKLLKANAYERWTDDARVSSTKVEVGLVVVMAGIDPAPAPSTIDKSLWTLRAINPFVATFGTKIQISPAITKHQSL